ncbi:hypothetical protein PS928_05019 [Pseudomonas fluorescens]|uniref:HTH IS408-type domain-containing protein n=1 Tax=Pseudomonas fluorescens TaxID=294 RepID=A0A5E7VDA3_PSEFL|nr:hypothetical protein PS928_05019 [Pseudomonas fluorescens]
MRKIREVLRLKFDAGLSVRKIAESLAISHSSAGDYLCRFAASGLQWPIDLSDAELNRRLFPPAVPDWLSSHVRCFAFLGGTSQILVPDNLRSGVTKAHRYEPDINPSYRDLAEHYGVAVLPARSRKPRDKAKVEVGVQVVERWILAVLRNRQFFSLGELNTAIGLLLDRLNQKPFKKLPGSRRSAFETIDRPALQALPEHPYVYAE